LAPHGATLFFVASALVTWPIMAEYELFETFYEFSRAHEDWDIDELSLLVVNLTLALIFSLWAQSRRLKRTAEERDTQRARAERTARHDPLTGLLNRRAFLAELLSIEQRQDRATCYGVAMIDLDRFKPINDIYGHAAGDLALQVVAKRLSDELDDKAVLARLGGDEFAVVFEMSAGAEMVERIARRLLQANHEAIEFGSQQFHVSYSIGMASWPDDKPLAEALRRADKALYKAKTQGRDRFSWYDSELDEQLQERASIENDLREAVVKSEIEPWFQPVLDIQNNSLVGFEVLARWRHESRGMVSPGVFVPIAEDSGLIGKLGLNLLNRACHAARGWGSGLTVAYNLSAYQLREANLIEDMVAVLNTSGFDPKRLTVEVTESAVIEDIELARVRLLALKELGVSLALDDFGTGYSSLSSLRELPFDSIKIDHSFVTNIGTDKQNQKIVAGIMALARGLELTVTAEGIETSADLHYVQGLGCSYGQGFLFEKALPAPEVSKLLRAGSWIDDLLAGPSLGRIA
jgi:diguanylate cyclase (GGDEF)-like protein